MKRKIILISVIIILATGVALAIFWDVNKTEEISQNQSTHESIEENEEKENNGEVTNEKTKEIEVQEEIQEEQQQQEQKEEINTLKENSGKTGKTDLYEIQESYNNTKIVTIKSSVKYKVAFAGMAENQKPTIELLDNVLQKKHPRYAGVWIYENDRNAILEMLKETTNSEYKIDENGYLKIANKNNQNENDKKIEKVIKGEKLYIIRNSSTCYIVDEVTGEILDYNFENMDKYQTYEYFEDGDKIIIFMNQNTKNQMTSKEIMQSVIDLF